MHKALLNQMAELIISVRSSSRRPSKKITSNRHGVKSLSAPADFLHSSVSGEQDCGVHTLPYSSSRGAGVGKGTAAKVFDQGNSSDREVAVQEAAEQALRLQMRRTALVRIIEAAVPDRHKPCPQNLVPMYSQKGLDLLANSLGQTEKMVACFEPQGPLQCAVTSLTIALNFLQVPPEPMFTINELQEQLRAALRPQHRFFSVQLGELAGVAQRYASVQLVYASHCSVKDFRRFAINALETGGVVIVNFSRSAVGYESHFAGHCSPIGAYNPIEDQFLLLDVAMKTWQSCWVPTDLLFEGMYTLDAPRDGTIEGSTSRGFMVLHSFAGQSQP